MAISEFSLSSLLVRDLRRELEGKEETVAIDGPSSSPSPSLGNPLSTLVNHVDQCKSPWKLSLQVPDDSEAISDFTEEQTYVRELFITGKHLKSLPHSIEILHNLQTLNINDCPSLKQLPPNLNKLTSLTDLRICGTLINSLPKTIMGLPNLQTLLLHDCLSLEELPDNLNELISLTELRFWNSNLKSLPKTITRISNLQNLELVDCFSLEELPENLNELVNLKKLKISGIKLKSLPNSLVGLNNLETLKLKDCFSLEELPPNLNELVNLKNFQISRTNLKSLPNTITRLHNLLRFNLSECSSLEELPVNWSGLVSLRYLSVRRTSIKSLPNSITELLNLQELDLWGCYSLKELPAGLSQLINLRIKFPRENEGLANYVVGPAPAGREMLVDDGMEAPLEGEVTAAEDSSDDERNDNEDQPKFMMNKISQPARRAKTISLQDVQPCLDKKMTMENAAKELGVSRSTLKRRWKEFERGPWPSSKHHDSAPRGNCNTMPPPARKSSRLNLRNSTSPCHARQQDGSSSGLVVKATYKEDVTRCEFACIPRFGEVKRDVGKRLNLDLSKFKLKYMDEEGDMLLMTNDSDLLHCLRLVKTSPNVVRLTVFDL